MNGLNEIFVNENVFITRSNYDITATYQKLFSKHR
jgi:hypothetical protein